MSSNRAATAFPSASLRAISPARAAIGASSEQPAQIADELQARFEGGAADGFNVMPSYFPGELDAFAALVVPELQRRGLFRKDYEGRTLRDHLGLKRPA